MKKLIILLLIVAIFAALPDNFVEIDRNCINPDGESQDYVRYINSIRKDVDPYEVGTAIELKIDSLEIDGYAIIELDSTVYADTTIMNALGWQQ